MIGIPHETVLVLSVLLPQTMVPNSFRQFLYQVLPVSFTVQTVVISPAKGRDTKTF